MGVSIELDAASEYLVVVDYSAFPEAPSSFNQIDFSLAWLNTFQQEIGPVSLMQGDHFEAADINRYRCIVLTQSAAKREAWAPKIRGFLERGGTVIMEMPSGALRNLASADGKGGLRTPQNLTYALGMHPDQLQALTEINLSNQTQIVGSAGPLEDATTWMTIDGVPVIYSKNYGKGRVITFDFNYGMLMTSLQQGRPLDDFNLRKRQETGAFHTSDLAQPQPMALPVADILERFFIYNVLNDALPVVAFWPFFDAMDGALIVSHPENGLGDPAIWMNQYEASFKASSTLFVSAPLTMSDPGLDAFQETHADIGLTIDAGLVPNTRAKDPIGWFKFSPVWKMLNVEEQLDMLKARLDEHTPVVISQTKDGFWSEDYSHFFRVLSAAGFRADASYIALDNEPGYAFSTGFPFMPIDTNGLIFNILEFPVMFPVVQNNEQAENIEKFIVASEKDLHQPISVSFNPASYINEPVTETFVVWQSVYRIATQHKHWITSILSYFRFMRARYTAELKTRVTEMQVGRKKSTVLRIEMLAPENGMSITVPQKIADRAYVEARHGLQRVREDAVLSDSIAGKNITISSIERVLVPLNKGFNAIDIIYE